MSQISRDEVRAALVRRGFRPDGLTQEHAEGWVLPSGEQVKLKKFDRFPLVIHPRNEAVMDGLREIPGAMPSPERLSHNSNFVGFPKRLHKGKKPIAFGLDFGFDSVSALERCLDVLLGGAAGARVSAMFDAEALSFLDGFMAPDNPQFIYWLPRYTQTLASVREALSRNSPEDLFELIWKSRDNAVSNAGRGRMGHAEADRNRERLTQAIADIALDGSPGNYEKLIARFEEWRSQGEFLSVPRLLIARAFAAIHPDRYHTTVDVEKQDRIIPWFTEYTGFIAPEGNWARKAAALSAHLARSGVFGDDLERRNMFPWFVFEQLRDATGRVPFRPGHTSRPASGEAESQARRRAVEYRQNVIQDRLVQLLRDRYGHEAVATEHVTGTGGRADALVQHKDGSRELYEIKPAPTAREAVRQALGQLLEYGYRRGGLEPESLHVVSDAPLDEITREYLQTLETHFGLKLMYMQIELEADEMEIA